MGVGNVDLLSWLQACGEQPFALQPNLWFDLLSEEISNILDRECARLFLMPITHFAYTPGTSHPPTCEHATTYFPYSISSSPRRGEDRSGFFHRHQL